jgi:hypothetical protein
LNENLKNVISDERNIEHRVNDIIRALETFSDVNLEYESFSMLFMNIEELLQILHHQILSVLMQRLDADMVPLEHDKAGSFGSGLFVHASVIADIDEAGYKLVYRIPEVSDIFRLYRVRALIFPMQRNLWGAMNLGSNSVAVNNRGYSFLYKPEDCE